MRLLRGAPIRGAMGRQGGAPCRVGRLDDCAIVTYPRPNCLPIGPALTHVFTSVLTLPFAKLWIGRIPLTVGIAASFTTSFPKFRVGRATIAMILPHVCQLPFPFLLRSQ